MDFFCEDASQCKLEELLPCIEKFVDCLSTSAQVSKQIVNDISGSMTMSRIF